VVTHARDAGETCEDISEAVRIALSESGCKNDSCDCARLRALTQLSGEIAIFLAAAVAIWASRGRVLRNTVLLEAPTIEGELVMLSLEEYRAAVIASDMSLAEMEIALARIKYLGGELDAALMYSFATREEGNIVIRMDDEINNAEE
jgi:hypothetical protein